MNIFLALLFLFRMASGTIDIDETFSEMEVGIGVDMAIHALKIALVVDISGPFIWVNEKGSDFSALRNLGNSGFPVAG